MKVLPKENNSSMPPYCYVSDGKYYGLFAMLENTVDLQCSMATATRGSYQHCNGKFYCYATVSPNVIVSDLANTLP
jgi:hypothetical protein